LITFFIGGCIVVIKVIIVAKAEVVSAVLKIVQVTFSTFITSTTLSTSHNHFFKINQSISFQIIPARNIIIAMALIVCITFRLKLVGRFGSFFLKKYMNKFNKKKKALRNRRAFCYYYSE